MAEGAHQQYTESIQKLYQLEKQEKEARRRALPSETPSQVARRNLLGILEGLYALWPPPPAEKLSTDQRSVALVEHAKRMSSIRAILNGTVADDDESQWIRAWQLRCDTLQCLVACDDSRRLLPAPAAADDEAHIALHGARYTGSWLRLAEHLAELPAKQVRAARDEPAACLQALEHTAEKQARFQLEAAVGADLSAQAARERSIMMGRMQMSTVRQMLDAKGASLEAGLALLLDRDVSELKGYARSPHRLAENACAILHPAGVMAFTVHLAHPPRVFHEPLYRRDLAKTLGMADAQIRITCPQPEGPVHVELKVFDVAEAAAARPKAVQRLKQWQVLGTRVVDVVELGGRPMVPVIEPVEGDVWFLRADMLRGSLGPLPADLHRQRSVYERLPISLAAARRGEYVHDCLVVSHAWASASEPDPTGTQMDAIRQFLRENIRFKHVWYDHWTLPQVDRHGKGRSETNGRTDAFRSASAAGADERMRDLCALLFLGCTVLVLLSNEYLYDFGGALQAWLAMQDCTDAGLQPSSRPGERCHLRRLPGCHRSVDGMLLETWCGLKAEQAFAILEASGDLNASPPQAGLGGDKPRALQQLRRLHEQVAAASVNARLAAYEMGEDATHGLGQAGARRPAVSGSQNGRSEGILAPAPLAISKRVEFSASATALKQQTPLARASDLAHVPTSVIRTGSQPARSAASWEQYASWVAERDPGAYSNAEV